MKRFSDRIDGGWVRDRYIHIQVCMYFIYTVEYDHIGASAYLALLIDANTLTNSAYAAS